MFKFRCVFDFRDDEDLWNWPWLDKFQLDHSQKEFFMIAMMIKLAKIYFDKQ